jgi:hypothetical protein
MGAGGAAMVRGSVRPKGSHNVVAIYGSMEAAREAVTRLDRSGIEAGDVSIVAEEAAEREDTSARDARVVGTMSKRVVRAGAIVAVVGAVVGFALGLWFFKGTGILAATAAGAVAGSLLGGLYGGLTGLSMSDEWELTFDSLREGGVAVAIGSDDRDEVEKAVRTLSETGPRKLERFDSRGRRVPSQ